MKKINDMNWSMSRLLLTVALLLVGLLSIKAQDSIKVTGIVVNSAGKPVADVSVSVEGSREMPVVTDEKGRFMVFAPTGNEWLIISPASGFKRTRILINNRNNMVVVLTSEDLVSGEDELMVLLQPVKKKDVVASFSDLDLGIIHHSKTFSVDQYMQGRIPGMSVTNHSGMPGSGASTLIRGVNSLNASNQPLYLVDGMIVESQGIFGSVVDGFSFNPLLSINPLDISKATVMKDALYNAAYGSKASNGLVMIQTLDPSATETSFDIDLRRGYSMKPERLIPQLDASQFKTLANELIYSSGTIEEVLAEEYPNLFLEPTDKRFIDYQHNTNWQSYIFQDAAFTNLNMKVKGGDEIARYGLSFGYYNSQGIIKNTGYDGYNLRFVSMVNIFTWLRMNAAVSFKTSTSNLKESAKVKETSPILSALAKSPLMNPYQYDTEGKETTLLTEVDEFGISNPLAIINNFEASNKNYHIISSLGVEANIGKKMLVKSNFGITYNALKEKLFMPNKGMERYYGNEAHNVAKASTNTFNGFSNNTMLIYDHIFGQDHRFNSTTGVNVMSNQFQYDWGLTKNSHENDEYRMLQDGVKSLSEIGGENRNWNWLSVYEKVSYSFKDKYLATATLSVDGSSRIGKDSENTVKILGNPFGLFYSAGLGWRISNEKFLQKQDWIDELKLRVSVGRTGNDDIGESNAYNYYKVLQYRETTGLIPGIISNTKLSYEIVDQFNAGIDVALWGNRLRFNFDLFRSSISNMLIYSQLNSYLGFDVRPENAGKMQNTGWDAYAFIRVVNGKKFKWDIETTLSKAVNEMVEMEKVQITNFGSHELVNVKGAPANSFYGYVFEGVFSTTEEANAAKLVNNKGIAFKAGDAIFKDISGPNNTPDGVINNYDKTAIGSPLPELIGGFSSTLSYKNWSLNALITFVTGNEMFNYVRYQNEKMTGFANQSKNVLNRWQYEGQQTEVPRALWNDPVGNTAFSSRWIEDGSYLRLKNISLAYKIPNEFWGLKSAEFYISASNLLTLSKYLGNDPEFSYSYNLTDMGIDYGLTPQTRQFMVGIKIGL